MITGEIKLHDEPAPYVSTTYYGHTPKYLSAADKAKWDEECHADLEKAKCIFNIGDRISSKNNMAVQMIIVKFVENIEDMQQFDSKPCVVWAKNASVSTANPIQYSLQELNMETHIHIPTKEESNDSQ